MKKKDIKIRLEFKGSHFYARPEHKGGYFLFGKENFLIDGEEAASGKLSEVFQEGESAGFAKVFFHSEKESSKLLKLCSFNHYAKVGYDISKALAAYAGGRGISKEEASKDITYLKGILETAKRLKEEDRPESQLL